MQLLIFFLLIALIMGGIIYVGFRIGDRLRSNDRRSQMRRGLALLIGTIALVFVSYVWMSRTKTEIDALTIGLFVGVPWLAILITGLLVGLYLLFSDPREEPTP